MMDMRYQQEVQYLKEMEAAKKQIPACIWFKDEEYYEKKAIIDGCVILGTAVYLALIMAAYRLYTPVDIEKRPKLIDSSKEKIGSREAVK